MRQILIWSVAWVLAIWLAWQSQGNLLQLGVVIPLLILAVIGVWSNQPPRN